MVPQKFTVFMEQAHYIAQLALCRKVVLSKPHSVAHNFSCLLGILHCPGPSFMDVGACKKGHSSGEGHCSGEC